MTQTTTTIAHAEAIEEFFGHLIVDGGDSHRGGVWFDLPSFDTVDAAGVENVHVRCADDGTTITALRDRAIAYEVKVDAAAPTFVLFATIEAARGVTQ